MKKEEIIKILEKHSERIMTDEGDFLFGISDLELLASELSGQEDKINDEDKIMKDVISLLIDRRKMAAIKVYWDLHGCGLKEAKIAVDKIEDELKNEGKIKPYK